VTSVPAGSVTLVIENCAIATMDGRQYDDTGAEHRSGHIIMSGDRITAVGDGPATRWRRWSSDRPLRSSCSWSTAGP
jgi:hypothetical protein